MRAGESVNGEGKGGGSREGIDVLEICKTRKKTQGKKDGGAE